MGIPKFYRWISERYPCLSEVVNDDQIPEFDNLYLDMNGIIHSCSHPDDDDVTFRVSEEQIFHDIFHYIDVLFGIIKPRKVFFMAVDGVAPRAKMNQQRARRFMSAKNVQEAVKKARNKGLDASMDKLFDPNCITPGTEFMSRLHEQLQYFVQMKITSDSCWQGLRIYLSGHNCPGEGEHKIMDFIRSERSRHDYDANTRHCLYGLDADLIMLGMCSHEPHFALLREEVKFGSSKSRSPKQRTGVDGITFHLLHLSLLREYLSWEFHSLKTNLSFEYNLESVIDDWVLMSFLVGNDFIPHLPHVHIHEDALPLLYSTYIEVLPQLDGYINEAGNLNLKRFEIFLKNFAKNDQKNFIELMDDNAYFASKKTSNAWTNSVFLPQSSDIQKYGNKDLHPCDMSVDKRDVFSGSNTHKGAFDSDDDICNEFNDSTDTRELTSKRVLSRRCSGLDKDLNDASSVFMDDENDDYDYDLAWTPSVNRAFKDHKRDYYSIKMKYNNISKEELQEQAEGYVRAIQWNLHYYYHGCCSWSWFYPHHYAPYISDVCNFANMEMNFELNEPFKPFEQLLAVLPAASADCLPPSFRDLMCDPKSPIIDFYPQEFGTDLNGKKNDWEAVVLIPFIMEDRLLEVISTKEALLSDEERQRNSHGPHLLFSYDSASSSHVKSPLPGSFPDIQRCTAKVQEIGMNEFRIAQSRVVHGLLPGVKMNAFLGFPTLEYIPHTAELHFANIKVFQQPTRKESIILKVSSRPEFEKVDFLKALQSECGKVMITGDEAVYLALWEGNLQDMLEIAFDLIGTEVYVDWPMIQKAFVQELWTVNKKYTRSSDDEIICDDLSEEEQNIFYKYSSMARRNEFERKGIDVGEQKGLVLVRKARGSRKSYEGQRIVTKYYFTDAESVVPVSLSLVVQNVLENPELSCSTEYVYPLNAKIFISSAESKYYGFCGYIEGDHLKTKGTLTVKCTLPSIADINFCDLIANYDNYAMKWYAAYEVVKLLNTTFEVVSRITGCVYVFMDDLGTTSTRNATVKKVNIGLRLKFSKRNQIIPDFTRRSPEGYWFYSSKTVELIRIYKTRFPEVFRCLERLDDYMEFIYLKQLFPKCDSKFEELMQFLRDSAPKDPLEPADGTFVDSKIIEEVEKRTKAALSRSSPKQVIKRLAVKPRAIFRAELCRGDVLPDLQAEFRLLDRVVCVKKLRTAPFGEFGTVIGLINKGKEKNVDILFDKTFIGGKIMRSSKASGVRLPLFSLINLTHGKRIRKEIPMVEYVLKSRAIQQTCMGIPHEEHLYERIHPQHSIASNSNCWSPETFPVQTIHGYCQNNLARRSDGNVEVLKSNLSAYVKLEEPHLRGPNAFLNNSPIYKAQGTKERIRIESRSGGFRQMFGDKSLVKSARKAESAAFHSISFCGNYSPNDNDHKFSTSIRTKYAAKRTERSNSRKYDYGEMGFAGDENASFIKVKCGAGNSFNRDGFSGDRMMSNSSAGDVTAYGDYGGTRASRKSRQGYPQQWRRSKSVKIKEQSPIRYGSMSKKRVDSLKKTKPVCGSFSLLKRDKPPIIDELLSTGTDQTNEVKSGSEKQEMAELEKTDAINEILERLSETKIGFTSGLNDERQQSSALLSPNSFVTSGMSSSSEAAFDSMSNLPQSEPNDATVSTKALVKKSSSEISKSTQSVQTRSLCASSVVRSVSDSAVANGGEEVTHEIGSKVAEHAEFHCTSAPDFEIQELSKKSKRRPRKSRVVANLGFNKN